MYTINRRKARFSVFDGSKMKMRVCVLAIAALCAAVAAVFQDEPVAYAQGDDPDYVDVGLVLEAPYDLEAIAYHELDIIVVNNGSRTAYDVEVVVDVMYPDNSHFLPPGRYGPRTVSAPVGWISLDEETSRRSLRWTIPALGGLQREVLTALVRHDRQPHWNNDEEPHEFFGKVTTASFESDLHKGNNTSRVWSYNIRDADTFLQVGVNYTVGVSVDNPLPSPGDTVNFTVTESRRHKHGAVGNPTYSPDTPPPIDVKVDIELTDGLTHAGAPSYHETTRGGVTRPSTASVIYHNGVFDIGTGKARVNVVSYSVTLPVMVSDNAVVSEQCLTAKLTGNPPPGTGRLDDDISDNVAKVCLGAQPPEPIASGQVDAFTVYPCVGSTDAPCGNADDVRVRAVDARSTPARALPAGGAIINVADANGRTYDGQVHSNVLQSVNGASEVSWQTATKADPDFVGTRKGVTVGFTRAPFNAHLNSWSKMRITVAVDGAGGNPPGKVHIRNSSNGRYLFALNGGNSWTGSVGPFTLSRAQTAPAIWSLEFEKLN